VIQSRAFNRWNRDLHFGPREVSSFGHNAVFWAGLPFDACGWWPVDRLLYSFLPQEGEWIAQQDGGRKISMLSEFSRMNKQCTAAIRHRTIAEEIDLWPQVSASGLLGRAWLCFQVGTWAS